MDLLDLLTSLSKRLDDFETRLKRIESSIQTLQLRLPGHLPGNQNPQVQPAHSDPSGTSAPPEKEGERIQSMGDECV